MKNLILAFTLLVSGAFTSSLKAQMDPYLGQIIFVPYNRTPIGWADCNGQLMSIAQNQALFSLLGTTFGGNGTTNFALPDMRGRVPISYGMGVGSANNYVVGQTGGSESVTLTQQEMPSHSHTVNAVTSEGNQNVPTNSLPADTKLLDKEYSDAAANTTMKSTMINPTGGNQPHENRSPFLTMRCIIATQGVYPSFN
ncbi:phage tail protein [Chryseobacterium shigense]|uniref:Microcystin-dependent protein n=1 Tax=Chryseobacterium shigense TaxID=297244 RepID=A0A1N7KJ92_9FLAO|nr:tail fiber protein [Chryseobacterium shigense]PQA90343.1 phage tail protein [Chryseobacterium shigense]SIS61639.1 Microcystin-dependent protein [Chryseobacterium shigense]